MHRAPFPKYCEKKEDHPTLLSFVHIFLSKLLSTLKNLSECGGSCGMISYSIPNAHIFFPHKFKREKEKETFFKKGKGRCVKSEFVKIPPFSFFLFSFCGKLL